VTELVNELPQKTSEQQWAVWDSTRLNDFPFRDDDIMIATWAKSGTTWTQQLVAQLVFQGKPELFGQDLSPWPEFRAQPKEVWLEMAEAQNHRRFMKSHSPLNCIPFLPKVKYLFIGRDAKDVIWSLYHHASILTPEAIDIFNSGEDRVGPPAARPTLDIRDFYLYFLDHGHPEAWSSDVTFWPNIQSWWDAKDQPNVMLLHYNNLKADFLGEAKKVAEFLDIEIPPEKWVDIVKHCEIGYMRELASKSQALDMMFEGGGGKFINKGTNGRWKDVLSEEDIAKCDTVAAKNLSPECATWLKTGVMP